MEQSTKNHLCLIPAQAVLSARNTLPDCEAVYYVFLAGGLGLLERAAFFEMYPEAPLVHRRSAHLYTGSTCSLRRRLLCHLTGGADQSSFRKTLVAAEAACRAISLTDTPHCDFTDRRGFDQWLATNSSFAFFPSRNARALEAKLLASVLSPLNLRNSRTPLFAEQLLRWRQKLRPRDGY